MNYTITNEKKRFVLPDDITLNKIIKLIISLCANDPRINNKQEQSSEKEISLENSHNNTLLKIQKLTKLSSQLSNKENEIEEEIQKLKNQILLKTRGTLKNEMQHD